MCWTTSNSWKLKRTYLNKVSSRVEWIDQLATTSAVLDVNQAIVGWKLSGLGIGKPLYAAGLRNNDVLKSVNGQVLNSAAKVETAFSSLSSATSVSLVIKRNGQTKVLNYTIVD